ncbi:MAG: hypothetical protein ACRDSP_23590 [Pseudonocardiaceae bacterium]
MRRGPFWETLSAQDEVQERWCVECNALRNPVQQLRDLDADDYDSGVQEETSYLARVSGLA